ncbi:hypothetical protein VTJ04DRAFT_5708 [Mycothermus thermophilus]|uniref:uncharacterized protein n=1 Tax=Humicola insolens TaxID=85995 RepID=UPI003743703C
MVSLTSLSNYQPFAIDLAAFRGYHIPNVVACFWPLLVPPIPPPPPKFPAMSVVVTAQPGCPCTRSLFIDQHRPAIMSGRLHLAGSPTVYRTIPLPSVVCPMSAEPN